MSDRKIQEKIAVIEDCIRTIEDVLEDLTLSDSVVIEGHMDIARLQAEKDKLLRRTK